MLSVLARKTLPRFVGGTAPKVFAFRAFSEKLTIPVDKEQQIGRRKEEMDAEASGDVGFNRDPIIPPDDAGTIDNPIMVPSGMASRTVGFENPVTHQIQWFNLTRGDLFYVHEIDLFFKMLEIKESH
ncbi:hypothetical protein B484DRAFT_358826 [Ochromonadaceae sp. CCMP2298]|nr:hypothetical protein B484DRAFT_358826 [Ochromonadaceae sp. CCMP2298]|mmetsp:Transcript_16015/g.35453  ORF Transcript_16015/g.35453 Transcript_16015/m.35453 type:complete len:127 (+) Transcript_16015:87-467(+)|eukprot:CAMPEP_0173178188 /NCGR_PEP_ID=MMETSP1141-20130122/5395_1 /TAXON_ID=483371 /ORGANISM="non described non described, Strain CCMP2298" /LENGTH=126 /DNA_ID=CAMNT_0014100647 /DNA_START=57 /DNA_END=437 /DNA_ORIENTATION=-